MFFLRHKISYLAIGTTVLIFLAVILFFGYEKNDAPDAEAAATDNVRGFAWSENIGWISFNSRECDTNNNTFIDGGACGGNDDITTPIVNYGVNVNFASFDKELSGYAWSSNVGWISFDKNITGNPPGLPYNGAETYIAKYDSGTNQFSGWARALSACKDDLWDSVNKKCLGSGAGNKSGGWDGWIKLRKDIADAGSNYGVFLAGGDFMGYAWGNDVVGWVCFNNLTPGCDIAPAGPAYKVYISNTNPTVVAGVPWSPNYCIASPNNIILSWVFNDAEDLNIQTAYRLIITRDDSLVYNSGQVTGLPGSSTSINGSAINFSVPGFIDYGHSYTWTIQVWDSGTLSDGPKAGAGFSTPVHAYPNADFSFTPINPTLTDNVLFTPVLNIGYSPYIHDWDFDYNSGIDSFNIPSPMFNYGAAGSYQVFHKITDKDGIICTRILPIDVGAGAGGLEWEEVIP